MQNSVIELNIGGTLFTTSTNTLCGEEDNFFSGLLRHEELQLRDSQGRIFIDRDGELFKPILKYLRSGKWVCSEEIVVEALEEAKFYGVNVEYVSDKVVEMNMYRHALSVVMCEDWFHEFVSFLVATFNDMSDDGKVPYAYIFFYDRSIERTLFEEFISRYRSLEIWESEFQVLKSMNENICSYLLKEYQLKARVGYFSYHDMFKEVAMGATSRQTSTALSFYWVAKK